MSLVEEERTSMEQGLLFYICFWFPVSFANVVGAIVSLFSWLMVLVDKTARIKVQKPYLIKRLVSPM